MLATGGGAFMHPETRALIKEKAISVWLKADIEVLARRVGRKENRPLLAGKDPLDVLAAQARDRYPVYAEADITVETGDTPHQVAVDAILKALADARRRRNDRCRERAGPSPSQSRAKPYDVLIGRGLIERAGELIAPAAEAAAPGRGRGRDGRAPCTARRWRPSLARPAIAVQPVVIAPGEATKSFAGLERCATRCWRWSSTAAT